MHFDCGRVTGNSPEKKRVTRLFSVNTDSSAVRYSELCTLSMVDSPSTLLYPGMTPKSIGRPPSCLTRLRENLVHLLPYLLTA